MQNYHMDKEMRRQQNALKTEVIELMEKIELLQDQGMSSYHLVIKYEDRKKELEQLNNLLQG